MLRFLEKWTLQGKPEGLEEEPEGSQAPVPQPEPKALSAAGFIGGWRAMPIDPFTGTLPCFADDCAAQVEFEDGRGTCSRCHIDQTLTTIEYIRWLNGET